MLQSVFLSAATQLGRVRGQSPSTDTPVEVDSEASESESESKPKRATCKCPNCDEHTEIRGVYMLAPNEEHIEPCMNCNEDISMEYDRENNWTVKLVD